MPNLLRYDDLLDALAGYQITVRPRANEITIKGGDQLPVTARLTIKANRDLRKMVIWYVCAIATGIVQELEEYEAEEYRAMVPERVADPEDELELA